MADHKTTFVVMAVFYSSEVFVSRLTIAIAIAITSQQHQRLKALAALEGKTIKRYVIEQLFPADASGDQAWRDLQALLGERIEQGLVGETSDMTISAIVDEELGTGRAS